MSFPFICRRARLGADLLGWGLVVGDVTSPRPWLHLEVGLWSAISLCFICFPFMRRLAPVRGTGLWMGLVAVRGPAAARRRRRPRPGRSLHRRRRRSEDRAGMRG